MAHYQNGQSYYQRSNSNTSQYSGHQSQHAPSSDPSLRRTPSYDAGDDAHFLDEQHGQQPTGAGDGGYKAYNSGNGSNPGSQHGRGSAAAAPPLPARSTSYGSNLSGYQHQYQPAASPPNQPVYNPQQFARTQSQYNPQAYSSVSTSYSTSGYQPYNPAAYQPANTSLQRQPSQTTQQYGFAPAAYGQHPPPPSARPNELQFGGRRASTHTDLHEPQYNYSPGLPQQPGSAPLPSRPSAYTPPVSTPGTNSASQARPYSHGTYSSQHSSFTPGSLPSTHEDYPSPPLYSSIDGRHSFANRMNNQAGSPHTSPDPSLPTPPSRQTPQLSPHRTDTLSRHPQSRPLPGPPSESESDSDYFTGPNGSQYVQHHGEVVYDDILKEVEAAVMDPRASPGTQRRSPRGDRFAPQSTIPEGHEPEPLFSGSSHPTLSPDEHHTHTNGHFGATGTGQYINYDAYTDDSDAEAAAGLAAMQMAEEQEAADEARRRSGSTSLFSAYGSQRESRPLMQSSHESSDSDYANVDMGLYGGGYEAHMHYGDEPQAGPPVSQHQIMPPRRTDSLQHSDRSVDSRSSNASYEYPPMPEEGAIHPFPSFNLGARVDTGGTGGLSEPTPHGRRLSFEDGDESTLADSELQRSGSQSPLKEDMPDLFYHPGMSNRPLPPAPIDTLANNRIPHLMPAGTYVHQNQPYPGRDAYPTAPDAYGSPLLSPAAVPRSTSLSSHSSTPRTDPPIRSKTDADRARLLKQQQTGARPSSEIFDPSIPSTAAALDLPVIPAGKRKRFNPAKLTKEQFNKCTEPWALSSIAAWIKDLAEEETDLREQSLADGLVALFADKVPTMNVADAEMLGSRFVKDMFDAGVLVREEEWVKFGSGEMCGVLWQLTGTGCYAPKLHDYKMQGRCYSHHCMRTLKKVDLSLQVEPQRKTEDWATFYKITKELAEKHEKKEIERQNNLHEIVTTEDSYIGHLDILRTLYRDQLSAAQPSTINPKRLSSFTKDVFGKVDAVKKVNEDYLLAQLKYRQKEQGPWIVGFSDIFREWIRKARTAYIDYAAGFPNANYLVRREAERNALFRQFLDQARADPRSARLSWDTYLKSPITRLQRYSLLLQTVHKHMPKDTEEKMNLQFAIDEIRAVTFECNSKVDEMAKKVDLLELQSKLQLRKGMENEVELNLDHLGREVIFRGDLQRAGQTRFQWVDTHAILFDHYLVLAKSMAGRDSSRYDVSKVPIPMDLIVLESTNDDPVIKSSMKGIGAVTTTVSNRAQTPSEGRLNRTTSTNNVGPGPGTLAHTNTNTSVSSTGTGTSSKTLVTTTVLEGSNPKDEKIMYPFRVKHLGKTEVYTLYATTAQARQDWCDKILEAKTRHAESLFRQNAEPFRMKVLADAAFGYDSLYSGSKPVVIKGTPLDRATREVERKYAGQPRPGPVCRAAVNCATVFNQPYGKLMCAIGTDFGVYISEYENPRGWSRSIQMNRVTQISVFEEFNLFLLISDKSLIAYHLDAICPVSGTPVAQNDSTRRAPQKLSGARDVGFFSTGRMKDRALVFYKKKDGISSTFKVLEPVLQKSTTSRSRFLPSSTRRGQTDFFREYDEFYIPAECYSINLFHSSLAISTSRGVEVLTLDKKQPWSVPNLKSDQPEAQAHLTSIAQRIKDLRPLGMFRLGEAEFLVAFEECAVYVNKHGDVSRGVVMEFVGRAKQACLYGQYLILFNDDFVEIRNAMNGRMKQVIAGKDIKCLDDGGGGNGGSSAASTPALGAGLNGLGMQGYGAAPRTVKISMQHPEYERSQVVVELVENEGQRE